MTRDHRQAGTHESRDLGANAAVPPTLIPTPNLLLIFLHALLLYPFEARLLFLPQLVCMQLDDGMHIAL